LGIKKARGKKFTPAPEDLDIYYNEIVQDRKGMGCNIIWGKQAENARREEKKSIDKARFSTVAPCESG
jgi:hypothetical protein